MNLDRRILDEQVAKLLREIARQAAIAAANAALEGKL